MDAISKEILHLCKVEVKADKRRAKAAREVRDARQKRLALVEMLAKKSAPRSGRGGAMNQHAVKVANRAHRGKQNARRLA